MRLDPAAPLGWRGRGRVEAEVIAGDDGSHAEIAWIVGCEHQRRGYARRRPTRLAWLRAAGVTHVIGDIHERNEPSNGLA